MSEGADDPQSAEERMREALGQFGRQFGITAFVLDDGTVLAESPMPEAELEPFSGHGDTVSRGDLVRVWNTGFDGKERLEHDGVRVNDYGQDWMNVLSADGGILSFAFGGPKKGFSRRLELIAAAADSDA